MQFGDSLKVQKDTGIQKIDFLTLIKSTVDGTGDGGEENVDEADELKPIMEKMKQARFKICAISKYSLTQTAEGISINAKTGEITVDSTKLKAESNLQVSVNIDDVDYQSEVLSVVMYDCIKQVQLPLLQDVRRFQKDEKVEISFAASPGTDCKADEYKLVGDMKGVSIDATTGKVTVDTSVARAKKSLVLQVKAGSQTLSSKPFMFEVFDCASGFSFDNLKQNYVLQKVAGAQEISGQAFFKRKECVVSAYEFEGVLEGITVVPGSGVASIDTTNSLAKQSFIVKATVGSQVVTSPK